MRFGTGEPERARICIVGCGGAGCNILHDAPAIPLVHLLALNDMPHPSLAGIKRVVLVPKDSLRGIGSVDPRVVKSLETDVEREIFSHLEGMELVFIIAGFGGGIGTWAASVAGRVAEIAGATTMGFVTTPFSVEGSERRKRAKEGVELLRKRAHGVVEFPNDYLMKVAPELPIVRAFHVMGQIMMRPVEYISRVVTRTDLPHLRAVLKSAEEWRVGIGDGTGEHRCFLAVEEALKSPWLDFDPEEARSGLVLIEQKGLDERDCEEVLKEVRRACPRASLMWGALEGEKEMRIRVSLILGR